MLRIFLRKMRKNQYNNKTINALLPGVRRDILGTLLLNPDRWWYMSDLAKHLDRAISSLQRELVALRDAGILESKREGNRVYYRADSNCPIYLELRSIITKTTGLIDQIFVVLTPFRNKIQLAFIYGSIARFDDESTSDVDLFIIGELGISDLYPSLTEVESQIGREITPIIYSVEEFREKLADGNHFLNAILEAERLIILGNTDELERLTSG